MNCAWKFGKQSWDNKGESLSLSYKLPTVFQTAVLLVCLSLIFADLRAHWQWWWTYGNVYMYAISFYNWISTLTILDLGQWSFFRSVSFSLFYWWRQRYSESPRLWEKRTKRGIIPAEYTNFIILTWKMLLARIDSRNINRSR